MSRNATGQLRAFAANFNAALDGTTSEAFARRIDRTLRTVQRWRAGESVPRGDDLVLIAEALDMTVEALYRESPVEPEPERRAA